MMRQIKIFAGLTSVIILATFVWSSAGAITPRETFPVATSFDSTLGTEISTDLSDIAFLNVIDTNNDTTPELIAVSDSGKGAIVSREGDRYRTFHGLQWDKVPKSQIINDITGDNLPDIVSLLPADLGSTKEWHYARITQVNNDNFQVNIPLRKNILSQSTIIAPNGKQYSVQKNNGTQEDSPINAIFLDKEIGPGAVRILPAYNTLFQPNQWIAYLLPVQTAFSTPTIVVHKNNGNNNFIKADCQPYIPKDIDTMTSLVTTDVNSDRKTDLVLLTHPREQMHSNNVQSTYNADQKVLTLTIQVPSDEINRRDLTGSYFSFWNFPEHLYKVRTNSTNQVVIDIGLPNNGEGLSALQTTLQAGDKFWLTMNDEATRKTLIYQGDGQGCFTYMGPIVGSVFETSFGRITLPGAEQLASEDRTVLTDTNGSFLPIDSLANRNITLSGQQYTIDHNNLGHLFLTTSAGDLREEIPDILYRQVATTYQIDAIAPMPTVDLEQAEQIVNIYRDVPTTIDRLVDTKPLATTPSWVRPIDIDRDIDIDLVFINQKKVFLKTNNERSL